MVIELILIPIGFLVAIYGTLIGAGGGFLAVPTLLVLFGFPPQLAVGTSLVMVLFNAFSGGLAYAKQRKIDYSVGIPFSLLTVPGAVLGAILSTLFEARIFRILFAILLLLSSGFLIIRPAARPTDGITQKMRMIYGYPISFAVGFISSIFGIGGGIVHVPAMTYVLDMPIHTATATSHFILIISAFVGVLSHAYLGHIEYLDAVLLSVGAVGGAQIGAYLSNRVRAPMIARLLGLGLAIVGLRLLIL